VRQSDLILLGVKPFQVPDLIAEIRPALTPAKTLISFAASVKTRAIEEAAGMEIGVIRAMPNTPSALGAGAAALCRGRFVTPSRWSWPSASLRPWAAPWWWTRSTWTP
jgi:pyrroline-5-carboxylate reductase